MKIRSTNPDGGSYADSKSEGRANRAQGGGFGGEKTLKHSAGGAQCLHESKIAAAVGHPSRQSRKHAHRGSENDKNGSDEKRSSHFAQYIGFALGDLPDRVDAGCGKGLSESLDDC